VALAELLVQPKQHQPVPVGLKVSNGIGVIFNKWSRNFDKRPHHRGRGEFFTGDNVM